jgi:Domain of unknown function (DUF397)
MRWQKSSYSKDWNQALCVEIAHDGAAHLIRDSKNPTGHIIALPDAGWSEFMQWVRRI